LGFIRKINGKKILHDAAGLIVPTNIYCSSLQLWLIINYSLLITHFSWKIFQEGHKPHCIISPNLNVGGALDQKASNGNTGILINGREITKSELQMLKLAGVQCAGKPHFWVNADGTYQEEGQKTVKGKIWDKPIVKLLSPVLSLPTPNKANNQCGEEPVNVVNRPIPDYLEQRTIQKLLLVGSGTNTILKQVQIY
jgi:hypothetical protein